MSRNSAIRNSSLSSTLTLPALLAAVALVCFGALSASAQTPQTAHQAAMQAAQRRAALRARRAQVQQPGQQPGQPASAPPAANEPAPNQPGAPNRPNAETQPQPGKTGAPVVRVAPAQQNNAPQPVLQHPAPSSAAPGGGQMLVVPNRPVQTQQHLAGWMQQHSNMPLAEQQRALDNEPGVRDLPPEQQEQLHNRLRQLNNMPEPQRKQKIADIESFERLRPKDKQAINTVLGQFGRLSEDRRAAVKRAFHAAIAMPDQQRQAWLNSPQVHNQFNDNERDTLNHLLLVQPAAAQAGFGWASPPAPHD